MNLHLLFHHTIGPHITASYCCGPWAMVSTITTFYIYTWWHGLWTLLEQSLACLNFWVDSALPWTSWRTSEESLEEWDKWYGAGECRNSTMRVGNCLALARRNFSCFFPCLHFKNTRGSVQFYLVQDLKKQIDCALGLPLGFLQVRKLLLIEWIIEVKRHLETSNTHKKSH